MEEEAKAAQEIAKTTGKAIDAAQSVGGFLAKYINGPLEQGIGIFEDKLKYMRWERQVRLMKRANEFLKSRGLAEPTRAVPMIIAIPLLQGASLEENDDLQDLWAQLLVNAGDAGSEVDVRRAFLSILEDLSPTDAVVLQKIYAVPGEKVKQGIWTKNLPHQVLLEKPGEIEDDIRPAYETELILGNLLRLGILAPAMFWGGTTSFACVYQTPLGHEFMKACTSRQ